MTTSLTFGVVTALLAALAWSSSFIVPAVMGAYTVFDFALVEFLVSGLMGAIYLASKPGAVRRLAFRDWWVAACLGWIGYLGYFLALTSATVNAGPVVAPAFLGLVPVVLAIAGNLKQRTVAWRLLVVPLTLAVLGLLLVNGADAGDAAAPHGRSLAMGIPLCLLAVFLWTWFGLWNQSALERRPLIGVGVWSALMMVGSGVGMLVFLPLGLDMGVFEFQRLGVGWDAAGSVYLWGAALGVVANVGAALAWTFASQRLPVALAAQLMTMEPMFGTVLGLALRRQWPTATETVGMALLLGGVILAIRVFHAGKAPAELLEPA